MTAGEITVCGLAKSYGVGRFAQEVVKDCSFVVERNRFTVMIGPSGVGKSTIIRIIAGFERPSAGRVLLDERPIDRPGPDRLVVFQESALFPWMTTAQNILYGPRARGENTRATRETAERVLDKVGLSEFRGKYPSQLSGGMQRRAELARAMINNPRVMILDEPFRGLDAMTKKLMLEYYAALGAERHQTNFFVTTAIDEAIFLADRLLVMSHRPTRVRAAIDVDLPRPRRLADIVTDERANTVKMQVLSLLHEEAMKAFAGGSKAAADFVAAYRRRIAAQ
jgi:NitT/TauT family transport system ATP-binding protein